VKAECPPRLPFPLYPLDGLAFRNHQQGNSSLNPFSHCLHLPVGRKSEVRRVDNPNRRLFEVVGEDGEAGRRIKWANRVARREELGSAKKIGFSAVLLTSNLWIEFRASFFAALPPPHSNRSPQWWFIVSISSTGIVNNSSSAFSCSHG